VVADEIGSPTYSLDLAQAVAGMSTARAASGVYHLVNAGQASRLELAQRVLAGCRPERATMPISRADYDRASTPPAWAVLRSIRSDAAEFALRPWQQALDAYLPTLCQG
jgi:dTDP-4-dehydrorhamnose reductase